MAKRPRMRLLLGGFAGVLLLGYLQRGPLLQAGLNWLLADTPLTLVGLQGLQPGFSGLQLQQADFLLSDSGRPLVITDLALTWQNAGLFALPQADALRIGTARLGRPASGQPVVPAAAALPLDVASLLQLLRDFPLASVELVALVLPDHAAPIKVSATATSGNFSAQLHSADLGAVLTLVQPDPAAAAQLQLQVRIKDALTGRLEFTLPPALDPGFLSGRGTFDASGRWEGEPFAARGSLELPPCALASSVQCGLSVVLVEASLAAWSAGVDSARMEGLLLSGSGTLGLDTETLQWRLRDAAFEGVLAAVDWGEYHLASAFSLSGVDVALGPPGTALNGSLRFITQGLTLDSPQPWLPAFDLAGKLALAASQLEFDASVLLREGELATDLRVQGRHDLASATGSAWLQLAPLQLAEGSSLGQRLGQWPFAWDLVLGSIEAGLQLQWEDVAATAQGAATTQLRGTLSSSLDGVGGYFGNSWFRGLATRVSGTLDFTQALALGTEPLELRVAELDVGLPLQDLALRLQLDSAANTLLIESLSGALLGGTIAMQQQRYVFGTADNTLSVQFNGLRLEQVLALTGYEDIAVEGGVSGEVPLRISADGIEVVGGRLSAEQPGGSIRYLGALGQGDASLALVRQALSNYRFDVMESSIDYSPDGELLLRMQLQGYNPELENGRRVNLNLNLSDDVPALLESLQAGRAIEDLVQALYE